MEHNPEEREFLAEEIRQEFIRKKREVTNRNFKIGPRWDEIEFWTKAADICLEKRLDARQFMEAVFSHARDPIGLLPNMIYGKMAKEAVEFYYYYDIADILSVELKHNKRLINRLAKTLEDVPKILRNKHIPFISYMRVFLSDFDTEVMRLFGEEAYTYLQVRPGHVDVLKDLGFDYDEFERQMEGVYRK
jgi:hypothetical protein